MKTITRKSKKISSEIADFIKDRWNVQEEDLASQPIRDYLDSLDRIELAMELEGMYKVTIMDDELHAWEYFSDVVKSVCGKLS